MKKIRVSFNEKYQELDIVSDGVVRIKKDGTAELVASAIAEKIQIEEALTVNTSTTLVDVVGLAFPVDANETYKIRALLKTNSGTTPDLKLGATLPSGGAIAFKAAGANAYVATTIAIDGAGADRWVEAEALVTIGATAGTVQLQAAQNTSDASDTVVDLGSVLLIERISGPLE